MSSSAKPTYFIRVYDGTNDVSYFVPHHSGAHAEGVRLWSEDEAHETGLGVLE